MVSKNYSYIILYLFVFLLRVEVLKAEAIPVETFFVGTVFDKKNEEIQNVFNYAMAMHNQNITGRNFDLQANSEAIDTAENFDVCELVCEQLDQGVFAMFGDVASKSFDSMRSYTNNFKIPLIVPGFPKEIYPPSPELVDYAVNMQPGYHRAISDIINHYDWRQIIYIYDSHDGFLRLLETYNDMVPGVTLYNISYLINIDSPSDAIQFLLELESMDRWGNKRIILDCNEKNTKSILMKHVQNTQLGRKTYHYLLNGYIMDGHWQPEGIDFGAINITGFRIVDHSRKMVRDVMDGLRQLDPRFKGRISAKTAFMYDGVLVLVDALEKLWQMKPDAFKNVLQRPTGASYSSDVIICNPGANWVVPFENGGKITSLIKKANIEGLTGNITFNQEGYRCNYTFNVMEKTFQSAMVKIGTWNDMEGLQIIRPSIEPAPPAIDTNKTYIVTTVLHQPYMMKKPLQYGQKEGIEQYYGFCKELTVLIANKLGIKYEIRIAKHGSFDGESTRDGWSSIVNALDRKEADFAVAPLAITSERERLIDFTDTFMLYVKTEEPKVLQPEENLDDTLDLLQPLSNELWICVLFSFFAVWLVFRFVFMYSPYKRGWISISDTSLSHPTTNTNEIILHSEFSFWNSFCFLFGSFIQGGSGIIPKSLSGKIVCAVWWFILQILIFSYAANLVAFMILDKIGESNEAGYYASKIPYYYDFMSISHFDLGTQSQFKDIETPIHFVENSDSEINCVLQPRACRYDIVNFAVGTPKGSPLREEINYAIAMLKKERAIAELWQKWMLTVKIGEIIKNGKLQMRLSQMTGIFYLLVGGLTIATAVAIMEFYQYGRDEIARASASLRTTLTVRALMVSRDRKIPLKCTSQQIQECMRSCNIK